MGILLSARLSEAMNLAETGLPQRLKQDFEQIGLPAACPYPLEDLKEAMARDKKATGSGKVSFILPVRPGEGLLFLPGKRLRKPGFALNDGFIILYTISDGKMLCTGPVHADPHALQAAGTQPYGSEIRNGVWYPNTNG